MAIDNTEVKATFFRRYMTVKQMKNCLKRLEDSDALYPNQVGNLSVYRDSEKNLIGWVDFAEEKFEGIED